MAKCEEGYLCSVCGQDVAEITESDLYLRYVIGWIDPETLHTTPERHIRCNPMLAQFIVHTDFDPVAVDGASDKRKLDTAFRAERETLVTRGWERLFEVQRLQLPIVEYPLAEVMARLHSRSDGE